MAPVHKGEYCTNLLRDEPRHSTTIQAVYVFFFNTIAVLSFNLSPLRAPTSITVCVTLATVSRSPILRGLSASAHGRMMTWLSEVYWTDFLWHNDEIICSRHRRDEFVPLVIDPSPIHR